MAKDRMRIPYEDSVVYIIDDINPEPWTAPEASMGRKDGRFTIRMFSHEQMKNYKEALAEAIKYDGPLNFGDMELEIDLYFYRQVAEYETMSGTIGHAHVADATNMQKATEDALQGLLFDNDRQIRRIQSFIVEQSQETNPPKVVVKVTPHSGFIGTRDKTFLDFIENKDLRIANDYDGSSTLLQGREGIF
jgi:Holliday junction resolvase RusA-like endonuclease